MTFGECIDGARVYLAMFDYDHYPDCFRQFEADVEPLFAAVTEQNCQALAAALVAELAERRSTLPRRAQKDAALQQKQVLALFLSPAARRHSAAAQLFSDQLRAMWCSEYPRNVYLAGTYEQIMKGFDANLLGLPLRKSKKR